MTLSINVASAGNLGNLKGSWLLVGSYIDVTPSILPLPNLIVPATSCLSLSRTTVVKDAEALQVLGAVVDAR